MKNLFIGVTVIAYLIAGFMLIKSMLLGTELDFIGFGVFAAWGTTALVGALMKHTD